MALMNVSRRCAIPVAPTFDVLTTPTAKQQRALDLIQQIRM